MTSRGIFLAAMAIIGLFSGGTVGAEDQPKRIIAAGGDVAAIVHLVGQGDHLIAVDQGTTWPPDAKTLPSIGYFRRLSAEGLLSLEPDVVVANASAGPRSSLEVLKGAGVQVVWAPETAALADIPAKIRHVGAAIGAGQKAEELARAFQSDLDDLIRVNASMETKPRVLFILSVKEGAPLVGGKGTAPDMVINAAGGVNAASDISGFKPMSRETLIAAQPDFILMTDGHAATLGGLEKVLARPDIMLTPAGKAKHGTTLDTFMLLGLGPRALNAVRDLADAIH